MIRKNWRSTPLEHKNSAIGSAKVLLAHNGRYYTVHCGDEELFTSYIYSAAKEKFNEY